MLALLLSGLVSAQPADAPADSTVAPPECSTVFRFVGQPECVVLEWDDGVTRARNDCTQPILVDASVQPGFAPVAPGSVVELRDLSAFTVGLEGELYRAVAQIESTCESAD